MAKLPIEIIRIGNDFSQEVVDVIEILNVIQSEIHFSLLPLVDEEKFQLLNFKKAEANSVLESIRKIRNELKGFHPYTIAIGNTFLSGNELSNLFGEAHPLNGVAIFTFCHVPEIILPVEKIKAYIAYFIARYTFNFLIPNHKNHDQTRDCVFDSKILKTDLIKSMKAGAICDECRTTVMSPSYHISASQFSSLNLIFAKVEELYSTHTEKNKQSQSKAKLFIGSSTEGLEVARNIQKGLADEIDVTIWDQGIFDGLGSSYLEQLEECVENFDYGVFIFTPDDLIEMRGERKLMPRDNIIFELGMFVCKLTRKRAFLIHPINIDIQIMTDYAGIIRGGYDSKHPNLQAALGPVCVKVRSLIRITHPASRVH